MEFIGCRSGAIVCIHPIYLIFYWVVSSSPAIRVLTSDCSYIVRCSKIYLFSSLMVSAVVQNHSTGANPSNFDPSFLKSSLDSISNRYGGIFCSPRVFIR